MTTTEPDTARPLRKDAARNRAALVAAGRAVFAERGLDASLDDVAHRAGVGVGTAYRHFSNKYELVSAIFTEAVDEVITEAEKAAAAEDAWAGLLRFIDTVAGAQSADRGLREVMMGVPHTDDFAEQIHDRITAPLQTLVVRAKEQGTLRPEAEVSDVGMVVTMLCNVADLTGDVAPDLWRRYQPMLLDGLRPGGSELPVPPIDDALLRQAMAAYKQGMRRACEVPDGASGVPGRTLGHSSRRARRRAASPSVHP